MYPSFCRSVLGPWRAAPVGRRPGHPHSNRRPLGPEPPRDRTLPVPGGPRVRGALLKQAGRPGFAPSARRARSLRCPSRAGSEGGCQAPYFCQESLVSLVPHLDGLWGTGPLPSAGKPGFSCTLAVGGPGLRLPSAGPGFLSPHSSGLSLLSQEGLAPHCPSRAGRRPACLLSVDHNVPIGRRLLPLPGEAGVLLPRLADRRKFLPLCPERLESLDPAGWQTWGPSRCLSGWGLVFPATCSGGKGGRGPFVQQKGLGALLHR